VAPILFLAAGCAHDPLASATAPATEQPTVTQTTSAAEPTRGLSFKNRLNFAVNLLEKGDSERADLELKACLAEVPDSKAARLLLAEIETPLSDLYPKANFSVTLGKNGTLSGLAATYLGDPLAFYGLARYNSIAAPGKIVAGQRIRIPSTTAARTARTGHIRTAELDDVADQQPANLLPDALPAPSAQAAKAQLPLDPLREFKTAIARGQFSDAAKAADAGNIGPGNGRAALLADTYMRAAAAEQKSDADAAGAHARKAGEIYLKALRQPEKARQAFQMALSLVPSDAIASSRLALANEQIADKYYRRGMTAFQHQDLDGAISAWNEVLSIDPNYRDAQLNRAQAIQLKANLQKLRG